VGKNLVGLPSPTTRQLVRAAQRAKLPALLAWMDWSLNAIAAVVKRTEGDAAIRDAKGSKTEGAGLLLVGDMGGRARRRRHCLRRHHRRGDG
jgi:hypothetical protein